MLSIKAAVVLGFLFAMGVALIILRWMREAEEVLETASDRASEKISNVTDSIATGVDGLNDAIETGAQAVGDRLSQQDAQPDTKGAGQ